MYFFLIESILPVKVVNGYYRIEIISDMLRERIRTCWVHLLCLYQINVYNKELAEPYTIQIH